MAGYVKVWTTLLDNDKFVSLSMAQRGAYLQLLIAAKRGRDDGTVCYRNEAALGYDWGCDRKTCGKTLGILAEKSLCTYSQNGDGVILIEIPNYKQWQEIAVEEVREKSRKNPGKIPSTRAEQSRADQTRPDQSIYSQDSESEQIPYALIIDDLNEVIGANYQHTTKETRRGIKRWWQQGFRFEDFQRVHRIKAAEWLHDPKFRKYLRPSTLYRDKFEDYLNQVEDDGFLSKLSEAGRRTWLAGQEAMRASEQITEDN